MYTADQKQKILSHSIKYGVDSAVDAFGVNRSSIYSWKKKLTESFEDYGVLQYKSTRSFKLRSRKGNWDYRIERYIQHIRMTHPGLTKEKEKQTRQRRYYPTWTQNTSRYPHTHEKRYQTIHHQCCRCVYQTIVFSRIYPSLFGKRETLPYQSQTDISLH